MPADTPMMRQYMRAKSAHPDTLVLFRMGDFYEFFFEDAETASRVLGLTLTSRDKGSPELENHPALQRPVPDRADGTEESTILDFGF